MPLDTEQSNSLMNAQMAAKPLTLEEMSSRLTALEAKFSEENISKALDSHPVMVRCKAFLDRWKA